MEKVDLEEVPPAAVSRGSGRRALDEALGTTDVAIKYYELDPGEVFSGAFHAHHDRGEVFVVLDGEATRDTVVVFGCPAWGRETEHDVDLDRDTGVTVSECRACGNTVRTDPGD